MWKSWNEVLVRLQASLWCSVAVSWTWCVCRATRTQFVNAKYKEKRFCHLHQLRNNQSALNEVGSSIRCGHICTIHRQLWTVFFQFHSVLFFWRIVERILTYVLHWRWLIDRCLIADFQLLCKTVQQSDVLETMALVFSGADVRIVVGFLHRKLFKLLSTPHFLFYGLHTDIA